MVAPMSNPPIRAVLLDYGGVIAEEGFRGELVAMAREQGLEPKAVLQVAKYAVYDSGFVLGSGTEEAFWASMREGSGLRGSDAEMTARVLDAFILRPWVIERVHQWRAQGYITGIASSMPSIMSSTATTWARASGTPRCLTILPGSWHCHPARSCSSMICRATSNAHRRPDGRLFFTRTRFHSRKSLKSYDRESGIGEIF